MSWSQCPVFVQNQRGKCPFPEAVDTTCESTKTEALQSSLQIGYVRCGSEVNTQNMAEILNTLHQGCRNDFQRDALPLR